MKRSSKVQALGVTRHSKTKKQTTSKTMRLNKEHCDYFDSLGINLSSWVRELMDKAIRDLQDEKK